MSDDTQNNEPAKADGQPDSVTRNVMPMAPLIVLDYAGALPVAEIRSDFERAVSETTQFAKRYPLTKSNNGDYTDESTQCFWVGFAIGMRAYDRRIKAMLQHEGTKPSSLPSA